MAVLATVLQAVLAVALTNNLAVGTVAALIYGILDAMLFGSQKRSALATSLDATEALFVAVMVVASWRRRSVGRARRWLVRR